MSTQPIYAGIGSRKTPVDVQRQMHSIAQQLSPTGWLLRSGHADGADKAFEAGAAHKEIHLPWPGYNNAPRADTHICPKPTNRLVEIAATYHPIWDKLTPTVKLLMVRNASIVLGVDAVTPAKMVICWTPNAKLVGGTAHGMKIAYAYDIPVFNIADPADQVKLCKFVLER